MKKFLFGLILGFGLGAAAFSYADATDRSIEYILNRCYIEATEELRIE